MTRQNTQFWVAVIGMIGLVGITAMSVAGAIWSNVPNELSYLLVGGLLSITSTSAAWLFRINNHSRDTG